MNGVDHRTLPSEILIAVTLLEYLFGPGDRVAGMKSGEGFPMGRKTVPVSTSIAPPVQLVQPPFRVALGLVVTQSPTQSWVCQSFLPVAMSTPVTVPFWA